MKIATFENADHMKRTIKAFMDNHPNWSVMQKGHWDIFPVAIGIEPDHKLKCITIHSLRADEMKAAAVVLNG